MYKEFKIKHIGDIPFIYHKDNSGLICIIIIFNCGAVTEESNVSGISHFVEHLIFGPSKNCNNNLLNNVKCIKPVIFMGNNSISYNAFTGNELTGFYLKGNKDDFDFMINIIYDILVNPLFLKEEIEKERKIILEEKANMNDSPSDLASEQFYKILFKNHVLSNSVIGTDKSINFIQQKHIIDYFNKFYKNPNNIIISIGGDYDNSHFNQIETKFNKINDIYYHSKYKQYKIPYVNKEYNYPLSPKQNIYYKSDILTGGISNNLPNHTHLKMSKFDKTYIYITFKFHYNDKYELELISSMIGKGLSSILYQQLREETNNPLIYSLSTSVIEHKDYGIFLITTNTNMDDKIKDIIDIILNTIINDFNKLKYKNMKTNNYVKINDNMLKSHKKKIKNDMLESQLSYFDITYDTVLNLFQFINRNPDYKSNIFPKSLKLKTILDKYQQITLKDLQKIALNTFKKENLCIITIGNMDFKYNF